MAAVLAIIGVACVLYGVSVMTIWSGTWFFAVWYAIGAVLLLAAWCVHSGIWEQAPIALKRVIEGVCCVVIVGIVVFGGMALSGFGQRGEDGLDYIVVLGAQVREDGPSEVLRYRLDAAYDYLVENENTLCIVSGGKSASEPCAEAQVMAEYLEARGIDAHRIVQEGASTNTAENIENSMEYFDAGTDHIGIVTNDFHVFRGTGIARKKGVRNVCGIAAYSSPWYLPNNLLREAFSIAKDFATGNL